jgi:hypothetical protein
MINVGTANKFVVREVKTDLTGKVAAGQWGQKINHINLDETKVIKNKAIQVTVNEITTHKISDKLYDNIIPGTSGQSYQQQSLFSTMNDPINKAAANKKARAHNTVLNVSDITPIPYIGAGHSIKVFQGRGDKSKSKADGAYIISDINHMFHRNDDNTLEYNQNMTLIREMI